MSLINMLWFTVIYFNTCTYFVWNSLFSGKYVGNRPIKLRKSNWKERTDVEALQRQKVYTMFPSLAKFACLLVRSNFLSSYFPSFRIIFRRNLKHKRRGFFTSKALLGCTGVSPVEQDCKFLFRLHDSFNFE